MNLINMCMKFVTIPVCILFALGVIEERFLSKRRGILVAILRQGLVPIVLQVAETVVGGMRGSRREIEEVGGETAEKIVGRHVIEIRITALQELIGILNAGHGGEIVRGNVKAGEGEIVTKNGGEIVTKNGGEIVTKNGGEIVKGNVKVGEGEIMKGNVRAGEGEIVKGTVKAGEGEIVKGNVMVGAIVGEEGEIVTKNEEE